MEKITEENVQGIIAQINKKANKELIKDFCIKDLIDEETNQKCYTVISLILNGRFVYNTEVFDAWKVTFGANNCGVSVDKNRLVVHLNFIYD